jgi:hypothetical protein
MSTPDDKPSVKKVPASPPARLPAAPTIMPTGLPPAGGPGIKSLAADPQKMPNAIHIMIATRPPIYFMAGIKDPRALPQN